MRYTLGNFQHIGARNEQQDAFGFSDPEDHHFVKHGGVVGLLVDGMGGMRYGAAAAQTAVRSFLSAYRQKVASESITHALERSLHTANEAVVEFARQREAEGETGATLVAAVLHGEDLHWISAGDSRAYLVRDGHLYQLTADHTYGAELDKEVAAGTVDDHEAARHPERDSVTSFIGMPEPPATDSNAQAFPLAQGDRVLLCSDGLYRTLSEEEIKSSLGGEPQTACERLVQEVVNRNLAGQDNVTVVIMAPAPNAVTLAQILHRSFIALVIIDVLLSMLVAYKLAKGIGNHRRSPPTSLVTPPGWAQPLVAARFDAGPRRPRTGVTGDAARRKRQDRSRTAIAGFLYRVRSSPRLPGRVSVNQRLGRGR